MGCQLNRPRIAAALFAVLLAPGQPGLEAQTACNSQSGAGSTTTFGLYAPPVSPVTKTPGVSFQPFSLPPLPAMSSIDLVSIKAAAAPFVKSSFSSPPQVQFSPVMIRAPGTTTNPIALVPTISFQGIVQPPVQFEPASPDIAVGPGDVLMVVNSSIAQFTKAGVLVQNTQFADFFSALLPTICPNGASNCLIYDPSIRYDQLHGRFLFLATSRGTANTGYLPGYLLLSVSNGATYASGWKTWVMNVSLDGNSVTANWGDFWRFGFDSTALYLSGNMFDGSLNFQYAKIRVVNKSDLYNQSATTLPYQDLFNLANQDGSLADSIAPVHVRGKPSTGSAPLLVNTNDVTVTPAPNYLTVWKLDPTSTPLGCIRNTVTVTTYDVPAKAPQLGGGATLDSGDRRVLKAVYRDGFLYTARDSGYSDAKITVTYDVVDTSAMSLVSQARILNSNSFYPAFDVPATTPSGAPFASPITGTTTASDGSLTYAGVSYLKAGKDYFDTTNGESSSSNGIANRWGDYFGGAVDPVTGGLWASGQYAETEQANVSPGIAGLWGTWAGYFPWLTTPAFTDVQQPFADYANVIGLWGITSGCTASTFCPTATITRGQIATFIIRSMEGNPCPNNTSCTGGFTYAATPYFTDVLATDSDFPYVQKLRDLGITSGCTAMTFCPNDMVPRWAAAVLLVRGKLKALFGDSFTYPSTPSFEDVAPTSSTFPYIQKLFELGITSGCTATQFCPDEPITRQQAAVFIVRAFLN